MRLREDVYLVGGGNSGFNLSGSLDCHVYLLDGGDDLVLVDTGAGIDSSVDEILANIERDGLDVRRISRIFLTHYHGDHVGAAAEFAERLGVSVHSSNLTAWAVSTGDDEVTSLAFGKRTGLYPCGFQLRPCNVIGDLREGAQVEIGKLNLTVYETPGHSSGHLSFVVDGPNGSALLGGDLVCHGGSVMMQNTADCNIQDYAASVFKLESLQFEAFLPGHHAISLRDGTRHIAAAASSFRQLPLPPNALRQ